MLVMGSEVNVWNKDNNLHNHTICNFPISHEIMNLLEATSDTDARTVRSMQVGTYAGLPLNLQLIVYHSAKILKAAKITKSSSSATITILIY